MLNLNFINVKYISSFFGNRNLLHNKLFISKNVLFFKYSLEYSIKNQAVLKRHNIGRSYFKTFIIIRLIYKIQSLLNFYLPIHSASEKIYEDFTD